MSGTIRVKKLITLDPVTDDYRGLSAVLKRLKYGGPPSTVDYFANWLQDKGHETEVDLYLHQMSQNDTAYVNLLGVDPINPPFAGVRGDFLPFGDSQDGMQVRLNGGIYGGSLPSYVEYFLDPLSDTLYDSSNAFDGKLHGVDVQHDTLPYFVRGHKTIDHPSGAPLPNWMKEVETAFN